MNRRVLLVVVLVLLDLPLYLVLFRALFRGSFRSDEGPGGSDSGQPRRPRLAELFDPIFLKDGGGETKLMLLAITAALLVLIEYSLVLRLLPGIFR